MGSPFNTVQPPSGGGEYGADTQLDPEDTEMQNPAQPVTGAGQGGGGSQMFIVTATNRVEFGPAFRVGPRDVVQISPLDTNTSTVYYSTAGPDSARVGPHIGLTAPSPLTTPAVFPGVAVRTVRVSNLNEIGIFPVVSGEGVIITVDIRGR